MIRPALRVGIVFLICGNMCIFTAGVMKQLSAEDMLKKARLQSAFDSAFSVGLQLYEDSSKPEGGIESDFTHDGIKTRYMIHRLADGKTYIKITAYQGGQVFTREYLEVTDRPSFAPFTARQAAGSVFMPDAGNTFNAATTGPAEIAGAFANSPAASAMTATAVPSSPANSTEFKKIGP